MLQEVEVVQPIMQYQQDKVEVMEWEELVLKAILMQPQ